MESDAELIEAAKRGDLAAFDTLYRRHREWVVGLAYRFTGNRDDALDVLQEAFAYVLRKLPDLVLRSRFTTFLYPAVKHLSLDRIKAARRHAPLPGDLVGARGLPPDLREWLDGLPDAQRELLSLRYGDGFALAEIAEILDLPLGTVKSRLHHALAALRKKIPRD